MRNEFVQTKNWSRFQGAISALNSRGAQECRLTVVDGKPGLGKTTILTKWAVNEGGIYLRAKAEWTPNWLLGELLTELHVAPPHGRNARFNAALEAIGAKMIAAEMSGTQFGIVIDEADHVARKALLVETLRDLADIAAVPVMLVGMGAIRDQLKRYPQVSSRVSRYVRFEPADQEDVQRFLDVQCEVPVAPSLASFVLKATGGFNREIREAIVSIERTAERLDRKPDQPLELEQMTGRHLINDRATGQPIHVKAAV